MGDVFSRGFLRYHGAALEIAKKHRGAEGRYMPAARSPQYKPHFINQLPAAARARQSHVKIRRLMY